MGGAGQPFYSVCIFLINQQRSLRLSNPIAFALELYTIATLATLGLYCAGRRFPRESVELPMFFRSCLALVLALAALLAPQAIPQTPAKAQPTTPAGRTFKTWLQGFKSGDRALLDAYLHKYDPSKSLYNEMQF